MEPIAGPRGTGRAGPASTAAWPGGRAPPADGTTAPDRRPRGGGTRAGRWRIGETPVAGGPAGV